MRIIKLMNAIRKETQMETDFANISGVFKTNTDLVIRPLTQR